MEDHIQSRGTKALTKNVEDDVMTTIPFSIPSNHTVYARFHPNKYLHIFIMTLLLATSAATAFPQESDYKRTIIVPSTGNQVADGTALLSVLNRLSTPNSEDRWLVKLEPGIYDVGNKPVTMKDYVDIAGSGTLTTTIHGSVGPPPDRLLGALVQGANNAEIRSLTISCKSNFSTPSCQGISLREANLRLTQVRILVDGTGTGGHWGIRTFNSHPILDAVEVSVIARNGGDNYGIVYGGYSTVDINHSTVVAEGAPGRNIAIVLKEFLRESQIQNSSLNANGGNESAGIVYLNYKSHESFSLDNVKILVSGATDNNTGIGTDGSVNGQLSLWLRRSRVDGGDNGINLLEASSDVHVINSEVSGGEIVVGAWTVRIGSTWLRGLGSVVAQSAKCAGVYDDDFNFYPDRCL